MTNFRQKTFMRRFLLVAFFNTLIAVFITLTDFTGEGIGENFVFSQCIGLSIFTPVHFIIYRFQNASSLRLSALVLAAMVAAILVGTSLAIFITGTDAMAFIRNSDKLMRTLFISLVFGFIITYFFIYRMKIADAENLAKEEKTRRLISEKSAAEAQIRQLQAQIEPHFLFNTLSNVLILLDTEPQKGKTMLEDFIRYLRLSLAKIRENMTTIGLEMKLIQAYLDLHRVRMGERLTYHIDLPENLTGINLPPMLLQPLVENALKHGLEPKIEGGEIAIRTSKSDDLVRIEIRDTGLGFAPGGTSGLGLTNIRERLQTLFNDNARLILESPESGGAKAILEVPDVSSPSRHRR